LKKKNEIFISLLLILIVNVNPSDWYIESPKANDLNAYIKTYLVGGEVNKTKSGSDGNDDLYLIPWFNNEAFHSLPPSINFLYETLLRILFPNEDVSITVTNHPIPRNNSDDIYVVQFGLIVCCFLLIPITVPFIGASYVLFPIHERISNSKLLQLMNGISPLVFWGASFVFDMLNHLMACIFIFIVFAIFDWNHVFLGQGLKLNIKKLLTLKFNNNYSSFNKSCHKYWTILHVIPLRFRINTFGLYNITSS
jgi:hypothetical protein